MAPWQVGNYRLDSLLGSGGTGEVYRAYDKRRDRYVALKLLPVALSGDEEYLGRFQSASDIAARLTEPHVIPINDYGEIDGRLFTDMSLVDGVDLGTLLARDGRIEPQRAVRLLGQVAQALDAAHAEHLVHRDVKPSNILVTRSDFVYVVDFGTARSMGSQQASMAIAGATTGTLHYTAPEQFADHEIDGRADVYSLACVLHECLTGAPPFGGKELPALIYGHLYSSPPQASDLAEDVPPALDAVIARGLAKDPADRFATAGLLMEAAREASLADPLAPAPAPPATASPATAPSVTESSASAWAEIPVPAWGAAVAGWQGTALPPSAEPELAGNYLAGDDPDSYLAGAAPDSYLAGDDPDSYLASAAPDSYLASDAPGSETRTMAAYAIDDWGGPRPSENLPPDTSIYQDGGGFPPDEPKGSPARGSGARRLGLIAVALVALAAVATLVVTVFDKANNGNSAAKVSPVTTASGAPSASLSATLPTVAQKITVGGTPSYVQVAPNGTFAYITNPDTRVITVLNTADDQVSGVISIPQGPPQFVSFSPDGRTAYVSVYTTGANAVHLVVFIDTATRKVTATVSVNNHTPGPSTTSPDGRFLYVPNHNMSTTGSNVNILDVIDTTTKKVVDAVGVEPNPHWVVFGKGGLVYYVTDHMSTVITVLNAATNSMVAEIEVGETPHSIALSPDGSRLAITSFSGNEVFMVSTATNKEIATIPVGRNPLEIAYSPDGRYIYTADNEDNEVTVIDAADNRVIGTVPTGNQPTSISVLPNGRQAYVSDESDGTIEVLNLAR